jgi:hypothetical protein
MRRNLSRLAHRKFELVCLTLLVILSGCASNQLSVESSPEGADVYVFGPNNTKQKVGKTPFTITNSNAPSLFRDTIQVTVQKDGYKGESFLIPPASTSASGRISAQLSPVESSSTTNEVSEGVAQILRMIYKKNYPEAERSLASYTVKFASVPIFWDLLGNVYYLQKNLDRALSSYQTSLSLNPQNAETQKMISKIKSIRGSAE